MRKLITILLIGVASVSMAQQPKQHVYYDTIKTVKERVEYIPDTIKVYFKELIKGEFAPYEKWTSGYVIWQTYKQYPNYNAITFSNGGETWAGASQPKYYKDEFKSMGIYFLDIHLLYSDKKTKITNYILAVYKQ